MCTTPNPSRPSGSVITRAKLLVPSGGFVHFSGGEMLWPTQFGLSLRSPAFFVASGALSAKAGEVSLNTSAARAAGAAQNDATTSPPASSRLPKYRAS